MAVKIIDNGTHVTIEASTTTKVHHQKGTFFIERQGDIFLFRSYLDPNTKTLLRVSYNGADNVVAVDTSYPSHSSAATLETALENMCFV